jgi:hypothetical protein
VDAVDDQSDQVTATEQSPTKMLAVFSRSFSWCAFLLGPTIFEELDELFGDENRIVCVLPPWGRKGWLRCAGIFCADSHLVN